MQGCRPEQTSRDSGALPPGPAPLLQPATGEQPGAATGRAQDEAVGSRGRVKPPPRTRLCQHSKHGGSVGALPHSTHCRERLTPPSWGKYSSLNHKLFLATTQLKKSYKKSQTHSRQTLASMSSLLQAGTCLTGPPVLTSPSDIRRAMKNPGLQSAPCPRLSPGLTRHLLARCSVQSGLGTDRGPGVTRLG